ncbi:hypothetical protein B0H13DRAFT_2234871 [Mycena leptocephala]|nr:hypothetical protein B0H13DRAFT_2234871 [Mycena leptocephala]
MLLLTVLLLPLLSTAHPTHRRHDAHSHTTSKRLPSTWYHRSDHPVHELFRRDVATDGTTYAQVGSPGVYAALFRRSRTQFYSAWSAAYPESTPDSKAMPTKWLDALNAAVAAGSIPNIPVPLSFPTKIRLTRLVCVAFFECRFIHPTRFPVVGFDPNGAVVCSATYKCRNPNDVWDAPDNSIGISFDDGPQPASDTLFKFLADNNETATHFMIGVNILDYPNEFLSAFNMGGDIAVHTYTHRYTTTLSNEDVVAELGYTAQLIHDSTGGRVPKFWRVNSDERVRAIAKEVFGLITVIWNQDTEDWSLTTGGTTAQIINASMTEWITGPKSPGLIILEHELSDQSVASFMAAYPLMKSNNWNTASLAQIVDGASAYQNAASSLTAVTLSDIVAVSNSSSSGSSASSSSGSSASSSGTSASSAKQSSPTADSSTSSGSATSVSASPSTTSNSALSNSWTTGPAAVLCVVASFMLRDLVILHLGLCLSRTVFQSYKRTCV